MLFRSCGHATLGAVHALLESGRFTNLMAEPGATLPIETKGGLLTMRTYQQDQPGKTTQYWLDLIRPTLARKAANLKILARCLGIDLGAFVLQRQVEITQDQDLIVSVDNHHTLTGIQPDFKALADFCREGDRKSVV